MHLAWLKIFFVSDSLVHVLHPGPNMRAPVKVIKVNITLHFVLALFDLAFVLRDIIYCTRFRSQTGFDGHIELPGGLNGFQHPSPLRLTTALCSLADLLFFSLIWCHTFLPQEDKIVLKNPDLSVRATMAIKLRLGEKEILEKAVKSAAMNREYYRKHMEERAPLPRYEESDLGLLEGSVGDSRLPLVLRKLEEEAGVQESLSLTETVSKAKAAENGLINGENVIPNGTKESSGSMDEAKEQL